MSNAKNLLLIVLRAIASACQLRPFMSGASLFVSLHLIHFSGVFINRGFNLLNAVYFISRGSFQLFWRGTLPFFSLAITCAVAVLIVRELSAARKPRGGRS